MKRKHRTLKIIALSLLLLLALLPVILSGAAYFGLRHQLKQLGAENVSIEKLWLNPYLAKLEVRELAYEANRRSHRLGALALSVSVRGLFDRAIHVQALQLSGVELHVEQTENGLQINDLGLPSPGPDAPTPAPDGAPSKPWHFAVDEILLQDLSFKLDLNELNSSFQLQELRVQNFDTRTGKGGSLNIQMQVDHSHGEYEQNVRLVTGARMQSQLSISRQDEAWHLEGQPELNIDSAEVMVQEMQLAASHLALKLPFTVRREGAVWRVEGAPELAIGALEATGMGLHSRLGDLTLAATGTATIGDKLEYQLTSSAGLNNFRLADSEREAALASIQRLEMDTLELSSSVPGAVELQRFSVENLGLGREVDEQPPLVTGLDLHVEKTALQLPTGEQSAEVGPEVRIEHLGVPRGDIRLARAAAGNFPQLEALQSTLQTALPGSADMSVKSNGEVAAGEQRSEPESPASPAASATEKPRMHLASVTIGPDTSISFDDRSVRPPFREQVTFDQFEMTNVYLDGREAAQLQAQLGLSHEAGIALSGQVNPASLDTRLTAKLNDYQLLQGSGYVQKATGYAIEAGTLSLDSGVAVESRALDVSNKIFIDQIHLRVASEDISQRYAKQISMPLDQALDLLRNSKGEVKLQLPVTGNLDEPDVNLNEVFNKALGKALQKASISVLKNFLQPYSTVFTVAKFAGEQISRLRLEPMQFSPGSAQLEPRASAYAEKIADILKNRSAVRLKVCGVTNSADTAALQEAAELEYAQQQEQKQLEAQANQKSEQPPAPPPEPPQPLSKEQMEDRLHALALERSALLRKHLVEDLQIQQSQLLVCLPNHRTDEDAVAGVELLL